jgi:hypothetical protein
MRIYESVTRRVLYSFLGERFRAGVHICQSSNILAREKHTDSGLISCNLLTQMFFNRLKETLSLVTAV